MIYSFRNKQHGLTLIEMMVAMVLGILVTGAILSVFISNVKSASENVKMIHLNQELRSVIGFVSRELKRSGFSASTDDNYMMAYELNDTNSDGVDDCVLYAYDTNADGSAYSASDKYGFRHDGQTNTVFFGEGVTSCAASSAWQPLTSPEIAEITDFSLHSQKTVTTSGIEVIQLDVSITGEVSLVPGVAVRTLRETIRIRNESQS